MTFTHALATNNYGPAVFIVDSNAANGTHTTIQAAITAASSGNTVFVRPGTYTENLTLKAGVNLTAYTGDGSLNSTSAVIILGKATLTAAGTVNISGIQLKTNSDFYLAVTGSADSIVNLESCYLNASNNTGISYTTSGTGSKIIAFNCYGDVGTTGIAPFASSGAGSITFNQCNITNSGGSSTACTCSAGTASLSNSNFSSPITTSSTGGILCFYTTWNTSATNSICLTHGGSGAANLVSFSWLSSGTNSAISISNTIQLAIHSVEIVSTNTNVVTGAGTALMSQVYLADTGVAFNTTGYTPKKSFVGPISFDKGVNYLDTYATSTWTPTIVPSGTAFTSITYATQSGTWTKIGNMVIVQAYVAASAVTIGSATGDLNFPLPFAVSASAPTVSIGTMRVDNQTFAGKYIQSAASSSASACVAQMYSSAGAASNLPASGATSNMGFAFTIIYRY